MKKYFQILFFVFLLIFILMLNFPWNLKLSLILFLAGLYLLQYFKEYLEERELEENFPVFLRDLSQYIKIGMPLDKAIQNLISNNYGRKLNRIVKSIFLQMNYGIPFDIAIRNISEKIKIRSVKESLIILSQLLKRGGDIGNLFESMSELFYILNNIKKERLSNIKTLTFSYYGFFVLMIFVIFITFSFVSKILVSINSEVLIQYKNISSIFLIINSIFTGLVIGKISTGKISAGVIHMLVLLAISVLFILIF
ncbi:MAG: type II secretion system F family protein [Nanopusillaceae archaeon]